MNTLQFENSGQIIRAWQNPAPLGAAARVIHTIDIEGKQHQESTKEAIYDDWRRAEEHQKPLAEQYDNNQKRLAEAENDLKEKSSDKGSLMLLCSSALSLLAVLVAEYEITASTIPYVLGLKKSDPSSVLLCVAVVVAVFVLKIALGHQIWEPYQRLRSNDHIAKRALVRLAMSVVLLGLSAFSVYTFANLATARSDALKLKESIRTEKAVAIDLTNINYAIWLLALNLLGSGSLFSLVAHTEGKKLLAYQQRRRELFQLRAEQERLAQAKADAVVQLDINTRRLERAEELAQMQAEHFRERQLLEFEKALLHPPLVRSYCDLVAEKLAAEASR